MRPADRAWLTLAAGVITWDITCREGDTLSEACDRYMLHHPWLVRAVAFALAAHVCNLVPPRFDAVHALFVAIRTPRHWGRWAHTRETTRTRAYGRGSAAAGESVGPHSGSREALLPFADRVAACVRSAKRHSD